MATVVIDGIKYTGITGGKDGEQRLRNDIINNRNGMGDRHQLLLQQEQARISLDPRYDAVSATDAFISGLTNNEAYQTRWLAEKRFPEVAAAGIDPSDYYFVDEDGDLAYIDPKDPRVIKKEFGEGLTGIMGSVWKNGGPTLQFLAEAVPSTVAAIMAFPATGPVGASAAAGAGNQVGGSLGYAARAGASAALDGPPLDIARARGDLLAGSALSTVLGGVGMKAAGVTSPTQFVTETVGTRFIGEEARTALQTVLREGGQDVTKIMRMSQEFGIPLTRAEALYLAGAPASHSQAIQQFLQMQPTGQKLVDFYNNRALRIEELIDEFADELQRGTMYRPRPGRGLGSVKPPVERGARGTLRPVERVADAAENAVKRMTEKRKERASRIYQQAFGAGVEHDIGPLIRQFREVLDRADTPKTRKIYQEINRLNSELRTIVGPENYDAFIQNPEAASLSLPTEKLHEFLRDDFGPKLEALTRDGQGTVKRQLTTIKTGLSNQLKADNPLYDMAARVYDPTTPNVAATERGLLADMVKIAQSTDPSVVRVFNDMFRGKASPADINRVRKLVQQTDPEAWQNLKMHYLTTVMDEAIDSTVTPAQSVNKFLSRIGIRRPGSFATRGALKKRTNRVEQLRAIFEPEEFDRFQSLIELMQASAFIANRSQSATQSFQTMKQILEKEGLGPGTRIGQLAMTIPNTVARLLGKGFGDLTDAAAATQKEAYEDRLIQALINPEYAEELTVAMDKLNPLMFFMTQAAAAGTQPSFEAFAEGSPGMEGGQTRELQRELGMPQPAAGADRAVLEEIGRTLLDVQPDIGPAVEAMPDAYLPGMEFAPGSAEIQRLLQQQPQTMAPMPQGFNPAMSPTILPNPEDRELAARLQGGILGLG